MFVFFLLKFSLRWRQNHPLEIVCVCVCNVNSDSQIIKLAYIKVDHNILMWYLILK